jgi:hypothetical protein
MLQAIPLRRLIDAGTHADDRSAPAVFIASRLRFIAISSLEDAARASHSRLGFLISRVTDSPCGPFSQPGRKFFPATLMGFSYPSQLCSASRVTTSFGVWDPRAVLPCALARVSSSRGSANQTEPSGVWPRLLGFGPVKQPCGDIWRPRHGFCA